MKLASLNSSPRFHCFASAIAVIGSFAGWYLWGSDGGWQRQQHWGEGALWAVSATVGLWAAVDTIGLSRRNGLTQVLGVCFALLHFLSLLSLCFFIGLLIQGGPRL